MREEWNATTEQMIAAIGAFCEMNTVSRKRMVYGEPDPENMRMLRTIVVGENTNATSCDLDSLALKMREDRMATCDFDE